MTQTPPPRRPKKPSDRERARRFLRDGLARQEAGHPDEAAELYRAALGIDPDYAEAWFNLGSRHLLDGRYEEALTHFDRALEAKPDLEVAANNRALVLSYLGRQDAAEAQFRAVIETSPDNAQVWKNLSDLHRFTSDDPLFGALNEAARRLKDDDGRRKLMYALGKAHDDRGEVEEAFARFAEGARLARKLQPFDLSGDLAYFSLLPRLFPEPFFQTCGTQGHLSARPIFIVGLPRSGTTLVERILAAHPEVASGGESSLLVRATGVTDAEGYRPYFPAALTPEKRRAVGARYEALACERLPGTYRFTDKTPVNFRLVGYLRACLPNAPVVIVRRDPRDVALSCFSSMFTTGLLWSDHPDDLARYITAAQELMDYWVRVAGDRVMELRYEALVTDPEPTIRRLVAHCGLPWHDACLAPENAGGAVTTASKSQVRHPIYRSSVRRWKAYRDVLPESWLQIPPEVER